MKIRANRRKAALFSKRALLVGLLAISAISISCADTRAKRMDAWKGTPDRGVDPVHWGAPNGSAKLKDGRAVYTWITVHKLGRNYRSTFHDFERRHHRKTGRTTTPPYPGYPK